MTAPTRLVLFDIDGTLVLTGGAGKRAMDRAFADAFGIADAFADVPMGGRTDRYLIERGLERWGMAATAAALEAFPPPLPAPPGREHPRARARHQGDHAGRSRAARRPRRRPAVQTALLTGNYEAARASSSTHFDLWHRFAWGVFGDDHAERDELARAAVAAAADAVGWPWPIDRTR